MQSQLPFERVQVALLRVPSLVNALSNEVQTAAVSVVAVPAIAVAQAAERTIVASMVDVTLSVSVPLAKVTVPVWVIVTD